MDKSRDDGSRSALAEPSSTWHPLGEGAFEPYSAAKTITLQVVTRRPLLLRLTKDVIETYQICSPNFKYSDALNPRRFLTNPSVGVLNDGHDNANSDLILHVNLVLTGPKQRYIVKDMLGQGTFGQVAKCWDTVLNAYVAVKVIKNHPAYYHQALVEVSLLTMLNQKYDPHDKNHIVRILDYFVYHHHLCISFEMLGSNLYELIRINHFKGLSLNVVQVFSRQILEALIVMNDAGIIHCDLKPENILLSTSVKPAEIKVIDFGSACLEGRTVYSYIQSRYYRSPEVLLGYPYTTAVDMWSFGCIVAELFLGLPLFPGASEYDLLKRMIAILGEHPPDELLRDAKNTNKFFKQIGSIYRLDDNGACRICQSAYEVLTEEEYEAREAKKPAIGKQYFSYARLEDIIENYPYRKNLSNNEVSMENITRLALVDFLRGLVEFHPGKRWSPLQASRHPFVTGEPFTCPYKPASETPRIPVLPGVTVDHHPGGGHWLAAGLSPQVSNLNKALSHNCANLHMTPMSYGMSFGSIGSHGSFSDNLGLGSSYGSYGDFSNMHTFCSPVAPSSMHMHVPVRGPVLGSIPDARRRPHMPLANGFALSPSNGGFGPMSLGASPSQFTPPSAQMYLSTVSSPVKYGPSSPSRGTVHGFPLGNAAAFSQYNRRRNSGYVGNSYIQSFDHTSQKWRMTLSDSTTCGQSDASVRGHSSSHTSFGSSHSCWRPQWSSGLSYQNFPAAYDASSNVVSLHQSDVRSDKPECTSSPPDPADWDPNYSDEQLLQEDSSDVNSLSFGITNSLHVSHTADNALPRVGSRQFSHGHHQMNMSSSILSPNQRHDRKPYAYPVTDGNSTYAPDLRPGYGRPPHFPHNLPSRFGQQPVQQVSNVASPSMHSEPNYPKGQLPRSTYNTSDPCSSANDCFGNNVTWGRRSGHPITTSRPSSHARKDYGRFS